MNLNEFTSIKDKISKLELENALAKGKIETIEESWKRKYGFTSLSEAEKKLGELQSDINEKTKLRDEKFEELKNSFDWSNI